ncbi:transcriptional-regulating factor 1-like isoform X2 [Polyodon spathula]|uniref:transcriptional-regulating factor 1-like isoform X2 n=1 Tax=Polyodon spathula TaxID=7913 RepID=UPI001B7E7877|nr:transcriptional-regulating factor 1-like isoform X2 [Polyodon spathula]
MGDHTLYKPNHSGNSTDDGYYQQQPNPMATMSGGLNYGSSSLEPPQSSPVSPHFPHDLRDSSAGAAMPVSAKGFPGMTEASKGTGPWTGSGNHHQSSLGNSNLMWGSSSPGEATDPGSVGGYQYSCTAQTAADGQPKVTSSVLQKLDSFTQVFANQNLRIHQGSTGGNGHSLVQHGQSASPSSLADVTADRALRQLLSQKPHLHEQTQETPVQQQQRYQLEQQQMQRSFDAAQPKSQQITDMQQQQLYYEYQQQQLQQQRVAQMQHLQALQQRQQMQSLQSQQQMLQQQQAQYYLQQQQKPQQQTAEAFLQQLQQQRSTYYHKQAQAAMHQLQLQQQQQQMQPLASSSPYHHNRKTVQQQLQYAHQEQAHPVQHIQLSSGDPYYYQEQQSASTQQQYHRQGYQQSIHVQQQVQAQEEHDLQSPSKQYLLEPGCQPQNPGVPAAAAVSGLPEGRDDGLACSEVLPNMGVPSPPHQLGQRCLSEALSTMQLASRKGGPQKQQLPSTLWPQVSLTTERRDPTSPDHSILNNAGFPERVEVKNRLVCSMCQKEFKSLPALNGHMRSHGGTRTAPSLKQDEGDKQLPKEVDPLLPIVMPVSVPVKLPLAIRPATDLSPAPCCPPDRDMPVLVRMAKSPPPASLQLLQQQPPHSPGAAHLASSKPVHKTQKMEKAESVNVEHGQSDKKKYRHRPDPIIIPPPSFSLVLGGAILFQSQLRSPRILGEIPPYTPPPMLSPVRHAPGLFSSVLHTGMPPITPTPRVLLGRASSADGSNVPVTPGPGEQAVNIEPRINIGPRFQAQIPELQSRSAVEGDQHKASMVWTPRAELQSPGAQQRVEDFINMACSSVVPGGGTNSEYALHCLFENRGDFMATVEKLLLFKTMRPKSHPLADYHYAGSDKWAPLEKKQFNKALATHNKDFFLVQKTVKTKTVAQCVEYYYTWKKKLHLGKRHRTRQADIKDEDISGEGEEVESDELEEDRKSDEEEEPEAHKSADLLGKTSLEPEAYQGSVPLNTCFVCEMPNCGATFSSMQALNGHGRIHGGTNQASKPSPRGKPKAMSQSGYGSVKSSPAHSTTSGETDPTLIFPCKECGKVFFKIKSRNAHMKTHRQQEEQERKKKQQQQECAQVITGPIMLPLDHTCLIKQHGAQSEELHANLLPAEDMEDFLLDCEEGL